MNLEYKHQKCDVLREDRTLLQDLKRAMPELARGLQQLLDFERDVEATFARSLETE